MGLGSCNQLYIMIAALLQWGFQVLVVAAHDTGELRYHATTIFFSELVIILVAR